MFCKKSDSFSINISNIVSDESKVFSRIIFREGFAEFLGTLILVTMACGTCVTTNKESDTLVSTALSFGLTVACLAATFGGISGAHLNPAVTIGLLFNGKIGILHSLVYLISQILGGIAGAGILSLVLPLHKPNDLCPTTVSTDLTPLQAILVEFVITFFLVMVVCSACHSKIAPLIIGLAVTGGHLFAIPLTSASMNTARSFGPALLSSQWQLHYIYWIGPILGGICAGIVHRFVFRIESD